MRKPLDKEVKKSIRVFFRCTEYQRNRLQIKADLYAQGDLSTWLRYAGMKAPGKKLTPDKKVPGSKS